MAELRREGRKWDWAKPSEEEVHARLADCDEPLRDKVPDTVRDGDAGSSLLAMSALLWAVRRKDRLAGALRRSATSMDKVAVAGLKGLRTEMVAFIKKQVALIRSGRNVVAADVCDDDGEEVQSAPQAGGVAPAVADARGTSVGKPGSGVDEADAAAGHGVAGTEEKHRDEVVHGDDDGVQGREADRSSGKQSGKSVLDMLKKHWAGVRAASTDQGGGGPADEHATDDALPRAPPSVADKPPRQGSGEEGLRDKEKAAAKTAPAGQGPKTGVAVASAVPHQPPAGARPPTGPSAGRPADVPAADKAGRAGKGAAVADALKEQLRRLAGHKAVQQPPAAVDAPSASVPKSPVVAARAPADPKSALLRAQLGALASTAPTQQASASGAKTSSAKVAPPTPVAAEVEKAAEKGVRAALATGGGPVEQAPPDADIAAIQAHLDAANPRPLAISDTAHVEPSAGLVGSPAEPTATGDAVGDEKAKRKGKAGSQRKTREKSEAKAADRGKGKAAETAADKDGGGNTGVKGKAGENQKSLGEGTSTGRKGKDKSVGEGASTGRKGKEKAVGDGSSKGRKGKRKAAEEDVEEVEDVEQEEEEEAEEEVEEADEDDEEEEVEVEEEEEEEERGRARRGRSREKMELAYVHSIAFVVYDGFVSKVLMNELTVLDSAELERWKEVWEEVRILPTGMWTVMWARGTLLPKTRLNEILDKYRHYKTTGDALHAALLPAIWYPVDPDTEEGRENGDSDEKTDMAAWALGASACAVWCFVENGDAQVEDAVEEGKAAALVGGASQATADVFGKAMGAVLNAEINRDRPLGEVAYNVAPALKRTALDMAYPGVDAGVDADVIARATVETMAFWGMCPVAGPKLKA
ncbi:unnamed protein product [Closterium sp. Yama58-4]|nr:unnamed protein product [Closterium sp. Yama58-4]